MGGPTTLACRAAIAERVAICLRRLPRKSPSAGAGRRGRGSGGRVPRCQCTRLRRDGAWGALGADSTPELSLLSRAGMCRAQLQAMQRRQRDSRPGRPEHCIRCATEDSRGGRIRDRGLGQNSKDSNGFARSGASRSFASSSPTAHNVDGTAKQGARIGGGLRVCI